MKKSDGRGRPAGTGFVAAILACALLAPGAAAAQDGSGPHPDSTKLLEKAREAQARFESYRESRLPPEWAGWGGRCDEIVGRMCLRHGDEELEPPRDEEPPEVEMGRMDLLRTLNSVGSEIPGDPWVLGQRVYYLSEIREFRTAERLARECSMADAWWCEALVGYVLQVSGRSVEAQEAFERAFASMPADERSRWTDPRYLLDSRGRELFEKAGGDERTDLIERLWFLSDPLYLVEGNDRLAEQNARQVLIRLREKAANPYGLDWEEDLEQLDLRYGAEVGWERGKVPQRGMNLSDNRHIIGRHHPKSREFLPAGAFLEDPAGIPTGEWILDDWTPRTGYAPWYAPEITELDSQVARFRRGDSLLVVAAYQPAPKRVRDRSKFQITSSDMPRARRRGEASDPFGPIEEPPAPEDEVDDFAFGGDVESGVFVVTPDGKTAFESRGEERVGVVTALVPNGEYVTSLEVFDEGGRRAWRARQGVRQGEVPFGLAAVSDPIILGADGDLPADLDEALPRVLPGVKLRSQDEIVIAWEVYGLRSGETAAVALTVEEGEPGLLERAGRFLRLTTPDNPVEVSWEEAGPDRLGTVFRSVKLALPEMDPGEYTLIVSVDLAGRSPIEVKTGLEIVP